MNFKRFHERYEPYGASWTDIPHYIHNTSTDTITTLPAVLYPNAVTATVGLKGNMEQASGASPTTPIQPQETGERTGNLLPEFYATSGEISGNSYTITKNSIETHNDGSVLGAYYVLTEFKRHTNYANYTPIDKKHSFKIPAGTYTFSANENTHSLYNGLRLIVGQLGQTMSAGAINMGVGQTFTINADSYACPVLEIRSDSHVDEYILTNPMLNRGRTALPYEPYGYKIPILSGGVTTPVYLGEVQSTRQIKKLVLDGTENISINAKDGVLEIAQFVVPLSDSGTTTASNVKSTHFVTKGTASQTSTSVGVAMRATGVAIMIGISFSTTGISASDSFAQAQTKIASYLAAQYSAGTPVCVWYVLATPTTGIVNEPLRKIGDYADEVSGITIPVTAGANTISISTTLQPSEVTTTYKGWHPVADVHEYEGGGTNLFDAEAAYGEMYNDGVVSGTPQDIYTVKNYFTSDEIGKQLTISVYAESVTSNRAEMFVYINGVRTTSNSISRGQQGTMTFTVIPTSTSDNWTITYGSGGDINSFSNLTVTEKPHWN